VPSLVADHVPLDLLLAQPSLRRSDNLGCSVLEKRRGGPTAVVQTMAESNDAALPDLPDWRQIWRTDRGVHERDEYITYVPPHVHEAKEQRMGPTRF